MGAILCSLFETGIFLFVSTHPKTIQRCKVFPNCQTRGNSKRSPVESHSMKNVSTVQLNNHDYLLVFQKIKLKFIHDLLKEHFDSPSVLRLTLKKEISFIRNDSNGPSKLGMNFTYSFWQV